MSVRVTVGVKVSVRVGVRVSVRVGVRVSHAPRRTSHVVYIYRVHLY